MRQLMPARGGDHTAFMQDPHQCNENGSTNNNAIGSGQIENTRGKNSQDKEGDIGRRPPFRKVIPKMTRKRGGKVTKERITNKTTETDIPNPKRGKTKGGWRVGAL